MADEERWAPVPRYPHYEVSTHGRVRTVDWETTDSRGRVLRIKGRDRKVYVDAEGRRAVPTRLDGKNSREFVAVFMLEAFVGPRPEGMYALHRDDDKSNNTLENLYWGTPSENVRDSVRNGTHRWASRTHCDSGHEYTKENTILRDNVRLCRECRRINKRRRRAAGKEG